MKKPPEQISHFELCRKTAERFLKDAKVALYEYQSYATLEYPDVITFGDITTLYEIKVNRADFIRDASKECRVKYTIKYFGILKTENDKIRDVCFRHPELQKLIKQKSHLGRLRYYVCPADLIKPEEITNGFGLYYYSGGRFRRVKQSEIFRNNIHDEMRLLAHAFRKYASGDGANVSISTYGVA